MKSKLNHNPDLVNQLDISKKMIEWYDQYARDLPWRISPVFSKKGIKPDPYRVWISEIMLQQTSVKVATPFFLKFIEKWPNILSLHQTSETEVLALWSGLGYYRRARNLKACAEILLREYEGGFPIEEKKLLKLPGIGKYTSAAILTIAFGIPAIVVDGNVERIIARLFGLDGTISKLKPEIRTYMMNVSPSARPGDFAQAMMDLGATICKPLNPECMICPIRDSCKSYKDGTTNIIPRKTKKPIKTFRKGYIYLAVTKSNEIAMIVRPKSGLLGGMMCLPSSEWTEKKYPKNSPPFPGEWVALDQTIRHSFTHFDLELRMMVSSIFSVPNSYILKPFNFSLTEKVPSVMKKALVLGLKYFHF